MTLRRDPHLRGYPMDPGWERDQADPNWSAGAYHGHRMRLSDRQAAYGFHRLSRQADLLGHGGFHGTYDEGPGSFSDGVFRHPRVAGGAPSIPALAAGPSGTEDGGVRADNRYLRQYNAASPRLADGGDAERGYGHAPGGDGTRT